MPTAAAPLAILTALLASAPIAGPAFAQPELDRIIDDAARAMEDRRDRDRRSADLAGQAEAAFERGDIHAAADLLRDQIEIDPRNFVPRYNLACALANLGAEDEAADTLGRAIELGFSDYPVMRRDAWLRPLQDHPAFKRLLRTWPDIVDAQRAARVEIAGEWLGRFAEQRTLSDLRLEIVSQQDAGSTAMAAAELVAVANWADGWLWGGRPPELGTDWRAWVVIALPDAEHFMVWAASEYGSAHGRGLSAIGGVYSHDDKRLVAQDLGATLRHEFFHVLHWRDMDRLGQRHPIWIQEGLASLVEDIDIEVRGVPRAGDTDDLKPGRSRPARIDPARVRTSTIAPAPSWRTNIAVRLADLNRLMPLAELASMEPPEFGGRRPLAHYAQARALFLYLHDRGKLADWYRVYTTSEAAGYAVDPTGIAAIEDVADQELPDFEAAYQRWLEDLGEVPEAMRDLDVALGFEIGAGGGDGPAVEKLPGRSRSRTGLHLGDRITAVAGRPTRDERDLVRLLAGYEPGDVVELTYRRGRLHGTTEVTLLDAHPPERRREPSWRPSVP